MATKYGTGGNDSLDGTNEGDQVFAGDGDDTVSGNGGNDTVYSDGGNDSVDAGAGDDSVFGADGDDSIKGGDGSDTIYGDAQNDTIEGGAGGDSIYGGSGQDSISGGADNDTIAGDGDNDTIDGGEGDDSIMAGGGDDSVSGGAGNDRIQGDSGANTIEGGTGNDSLYGGSGADTFVIRDGHGNDEIHWFDTNQDVIAFDMAEIGSYEDVLARMTEENGDTIITFDNGEQLRIVGRSNSNLSASNFAYSAGPVCLLEGTPIMTERGEVAIEYLRPDDVIWTKDHGWQAIKLVTFERMVFKHRDDPAKPILVPKGSLGHGTPKTDLVASPQHRILQIIPETDEEVLVPAVKLIGENGIRRMRGKRKVHYLNIVMERHSIIQAAGCWVESTLVTSRSLERQTKAARQLLDRCRDMKAARRIEQKGARPRRLRAV